MIPIKDYIVEAFVNTKIYEMADDRREFIAEIKNYRYQIIENLALIIYAVEHNNTTNVSHWLQELTTHINFLRKRKVNLSKKRIFDSVIDAENLEVSDVKEIVKKKFKKEHFDVDDLEYYSYDYVVQFFNRDLARICCSKYTSDNKIGETKDDIVDVFYKFGIFLEDII